jgi:hypothetical protein
MRSQRDPWRLYKREELEQRLADDPGGPHAQAIRLELRSKKRIALLQLLTFLALIELGVYLLLPREWSMLEGNLFLVTIGGLYVFVRWLAIPRCSRCGKKMTYGGYVGMKPGAHVYRYYCSSCSSGLASGR